MRCWLWISVSFAVAAGAAHATEPLSQRIDGMLAAAYDRPMAARSWDAEFLRRVSLDLAGVISSAAEVRSFVSEGSPNKRRLLVDRWLAGKEFPRRMQQPFTVMLLERRVGKTVADVDWEAYLYELFEKNKPLDQLVRELLLAKGAGDAERAAFHPAGYVVAACLTQEHGSMQFWTRESEQTIHTIKSTGRDIDSHPDGKRFAIAAWEQFGKAGNNAGTEKLEEFSPHHGAVRIYTTMPKPSETAA